MEDEPADKRAAAHHLRFQVSAQPAKTAIAGISNWYYVPNSHAV
jgi:hypothetical protein